MNVLMIGTGDIAYSHGRAVVKLGGKVYACYDVNEAGMKRYRAEFGSEMLRYEQLEEYIPLHLGVVLVLNLMIGLCTPPVGTSLFICAKTAGITIEKMYKAILPFLIPLILVLFLITYVPGLVTWLPGTLG